MPLTVKKQKKQNKSGTRKNKSKSKIQKTNVYKTNKTKNMRLMKRMKGGSFPPPLPPKRSSVLYKNAPPLIPPRINETYSEEPIFGTGPATKLSKLIPLQSKTSYVAMNFPNENVYENGSQFVSPQNYKPRK